MSLEPSLNIEHEGSTEINLTLARRPAFIGTALFGQEMGAAIYISSRQGAAPLCFGAGNVKAATAARPNRETFPWPQQWASGGGGFDPPEYGL